MLSPGGVVGPRGRIRARDHPGRASLGVGGIVCRHLDVARIAEALDVSWNCANSVALDDG